MRLPQGQVVMDPLSGESFSANSLAERLEPFWQSAGLSAEEAAPLGMYLQGASPRDVLERMLRNLQEIHHARRDWPLLVAVLNRLAVLRPDMPRSCGTGAGLCAMGVTERALEDLERFLQSQQGAQAVAVREVIRRLRGL